jgi:hypothetical protein
VYHSQESSEDGATGTVFLGRQAAWPPMITHIHETGTTARSDSSPSLGHWPLLQDAKPSRVPPMTVLRLHSREQVPESSASLGLLQTGEVCGCRADQAREIWCERCEFLHRRFSPDHGVSSWWSLAGAQRLPPGRGSLSPFSDVSRGAVS